MLKKVLIALALGAACAHAELPVEKMGIIRTLPVPYPAHWVLVYDGSFMHMSDGKLIVLDADAPTQPQQYKGMINHSGMAAVAVSAKRREIYAAESFNERGQRGKRSDYFTIHDQSTLKTIGEVALPGAKRYQGLPQTTAVTLIDDDSLALVFNLTPASSAYVIDLDKRAILNEVQLPGCALLYPTGKRGFSSLCGDGAMLSIQLDAAGKVAKETRSKPLWDVEADPLFEKAARLGDIAYFPTFGGKLLPVDLGGDAAKAGAPWSLVSAAEYAEGWRPAGIEMVTGAGGRIYVLFRKDGSDGSHNRAGTEVWVFDPASKKRVQRIELEEPSVSLGLSRDAQPLLFAVGEAGTIGSYDARSGKLVRTLKDFGQETPFLVYSIN